MHETYNLCVCEATIVCVSENCTVFISFKAGDHTPQAAWVVPASQIPWWAYNKGTLLSLLCCPVWMMNDTCGFHLRYCLAQDTPIYLRTSQRLPTEQP